MNSAACGLAIFEFGMREAASGNTTFPEHYKEGVHVAPRSPLKDTERAQPIIITL